MATDDLLPVTLLFTDIQGSTRLLSSLGDESYREVQLTLSGLMRPVFGHHQGAVMHSQGDSFFVAFTRNPLDAISAALQCQRTLASHRWPQGVQVRVRMGIHTGRLRPPTAAAEEEYVGLDVHRAARLCEAGHGGQVLVSEATQTLVTGLLPKDVNLRAIGEHQLRDLPRPEQIYQIVAPGIRAEFPPLRALDTRLFNLPVPRTSLLGREKEVAELLDLLPRPDSGLITLSGPAGTGKTRLAIAVASRATFLFKDGICFVALAPILDAELVASTIVRRLGLQESGPVSLEEILFGFLRDRELLLVLDNFEHLLTAAPLVADLLSACPRLKVLATSRSALRVHGEREYHVQPLGIPNIDRLPAHDEFARYPAVALFAERAASAMSRFSITAGNFAAVAALCARLDGLPLAIELAAARASLLTPGEMLTRLQQDDRHASLDLLTSGARDAPVRHRSLRDAIGWSLSLLDTDDQALFRRLSVFVGGFTISAASALASKAVQPEWNSVPAPSLLDSLAKLTDNSLVQRVERTDADARLSMLETIGEYGREHLEAKGELSSVRQRHAAYFLALAEAGETEAGGPRQADWGNRLDDEHANFRAALAWSLSGECEDRLLSARLASALWVFWFRRAYLREGSRWIQQAYLTCEATIDPPLRAKLLTADGSLARMLGEFSRAEKLLEFATGIWRELNDAEGLAWALSHLGLVKQWLGQLDAGVQLLEESLTLRLPSGDDRGIARSLFNLAVAEDFRCNYGRAAELYEQTIEVQRRVGDTWGIGRVLGYWAKVLLRGGEHARAESLCQEALKLSSEVADRWGIGLAQSGLGGVAWVQHDYGRASEWLKQSLVTFRDVGSRDRVAECLQDLASLARQLGGIEQSVRLSACAETVQHASRLALWPAVQARRDEEMAAARIALGDKAFELAWSKGRSMNAEEAIDDALATPDGHPALS